MSKNAAVFILTPSTPY